MWISGVASPHAATHESGGSDKVETGLEGVYVDNDTLRQYSNVTGSFVKVKESVLPTLPGLTTLTISFSFRRVSGSANNFAKLYCNGVAVGTMRTSNTGTFAKYSEDLADWNTGDLLQLYCGHSSGSGAAVSEVKDLRVVYDSVSLMVSQDP